MGQFPPSHPQSTPSCEFPLFLYLPQWSPLVCPSAKPHLHISAPAGMDTCPAHCVFNMCCFFFKAAGACMEACLPEISASCGIREASKRLKVTFQPTTGPGVVPAVTSSSSSALTGPLQLRLPVLAAHPSLSLCVDSLPLLACSHFSSCVPPPPSHPLIFSSFSSIFAQFPACATVSHVTSSRCSPQTTSHVRRGRPVWAASG